MGGLSGAKRRKARKQSRKAVCARRLPFICHRYSNTNAPFLKVFLYTRAIVYSLFINFGRTCAGGGGTGSGEGGQAGSARRTKRVGGRGTTGAWRSHGRQGAVGAVTEEDGGRGDAPEGGGGAQATVGGGDAPSAKTQDFASVGLYFRSVCGRIKQMFP